MSFIANDPSNKAINFKIQLNKKIEKLPNMPYKFRKSYYYDDKAVRDLIFKGYTIPYLIDSNKIVILDIFQWIQK